MTEFRFAVRVKPGARKNSVGGRWAGQNGPALIVAVTAPAVESKANDAVRRVLSDALGVRRQDITVVTGLRGRDKLVSVAGVLDDLAKRVDRLRNV